MSTNNNLKEELKNKLREIFQFEREDLDFGIYRIMNYKREEIERFIDKELIEDIHKQLSILSEEKRNEIREEFKEIKQKIIEVFGEDAFKNGDLKEGFSDTPLGEKYYEKKKQLEEINLSEDLEKEIYNHLIIFFSRYYDNGDFISKRRYGKNEKYVIPYNGEEVYLYWVNKDQYYIKTTEYFRKYTFRVKRLTVNFKVIEAEEEKGNIKSQEKKFFILNEKIFDFDKEKKELNIYFEYRTLTEKEKEKYKHGNTISQDKINEETIKILEEKIPQNSLLRLIFERDPKSKVEKTLIEKHLYNYTRRNTTDYFIHKDLKGFLERELDFYIKNEFLQLEDLQVLEQRGYFDKLRLYLIGVKAFRNISLKIIDFLDQIENFQKKLWEKKKFVINTHYVITMDKIKEYGGEEFLEDILDEVLNNRKQLEEWKELFDIEVKDKNDLIEKNTLQGKEWKKLPIDTKYFDEEFKWKLLVSLSERNDLEDILDGILIKSENFQGLNLLLNKYGERIKTIYIDPPYNTGSDDFLYKDSYQSASWLTFIYNRLELSKYLLGKDGVIFVSIGNNANYYKESYKLGLILDNLFNKRFADLIWKRRSASGSYTISDITEIHEYILCWGKEESHILKNILGPKKLEEYKYRDKKGIFKWHDLVIHQYTKEQRPNLFYGVIYNFIEDRLDFDKDLKERDPSKEVVIYPSNNGKSVFAMTKESMKEVYKRGVIGVKREKDTYKIKVKKYLVDENGVLVGDPLKSILDENKWIYKIGGTNEATKELNNLFNSFKFNTAKPTNLISLLIHVSTLKRDTVLDFFAGSGTTAHGVMKLNKEDGGKRKFILIEMAEYFDTVIIPRIKKVAYSFNWKEGKPQDTDGIGVFFKYHTLEQYEDSLENIEFEKTQKDLLELSDYFVKYMLEWETKGSRAFLKIDDLKDPFNYKLKILEYYQQKEVKIDLIETFNYLLGLNVKRYKILKNNNRKYLFVFGEKEGKKIGIVWRSMENMDFEKDKEVIKNTLKDFNPDEIYINRDATVKGFKAIEPLFKKLMFKGVNNGQI
ncbi:site-specific DNA-methyltransferase [Methanothermococcus sp. SCGC AD-155-C09]|nr:site-specific DNA-methyltransferase [Methanothermococcus sp. SCGC AD-155-C09]